METPETPEKVDLDELVRCFGHELIIYKILAFSDISLDKYLVLLMQSRKYSDVDKEICVRREERLQSQIS